jgi:hypothetical protein
MSERVIEKREKERERESERREKGNGWPRINRLLFFTFFFSLIYIFVRFANYSRKITQQ